MKQHVDKASKKGEYQAIQENIERFIIIVFTSLLERQIVECKILDVNIVRNCQDLDELKSLAEVSLSSEQRSKYEMTKDMKDKSTLVLFGISSS